MRGLLRGGLKQTRAGGGKMGTQGNRMSSLKKTLKGARKVIRKMHA